MLTRSQFLKLVAGAAVAAMSFGCDNTNNGTTTGGSSGDKAATQATAGGGGAGGAKRFTIGMSQSNLGEPYRAQMNADIKAEADKHPELTVVFKDAQNDTQRQRSQIEEFVSQKVDLLIVTPKEAAPLTAPVAAAMDAGIPVIVVDRKITTDQYTCFIGADNRKIGKAAGQWIAQQYPNGGKVFELKGLMTTPPAQDRHAGFREGIAGSKIEVIGDVDMKWLEPEARKEMESALSRYPQIDLVFAHNDPGAHGAYLAAQAAGREKGMKFVGIDALPQEGVAYVKGGILDASFQYPTGGAEAVQTALKILNGEKVEKEITLPSKFFTKDNVEQGGAPLP